MATDINKKSDLGDTDITSTAKVGDGGRVVGTRTLRVRNVGKKLPPVASILLAVAVLSVGWLAFSKLHTGNKVYAQAAGHKIYKQDVKNLIGNTEGVSDRQAATVLANKYLTEAMAKQQGITVTDQDIQATYGPTIKYQKIHNKYAYQFQVNQLYFDKLQAHNAGVYKGWLLVTQFNRYIALQPPTAAEKAAEPNKGNPAAIAADKKYAQSLITSLYNQINARTLTFDQAAQIERNDPMVGEGAYPTLSHSNSFDTTQGMISLFQPASARKQISTLKPGQTSKPFVVTASNSVDPSYKKTFEAYFLVVHVDSASGGNSGASFQQELANAQKQFGYKVYV